MSARLWRKNKNLPAGADQITKMSSSAAAAKMQKIMLQPISLIFRYLQNKMTICIWLFDHAEFRIQGRIIVFLPIQFLGL